MKKIFYLLFLNICFSFGQNLEKDSIPAIQIKAFNSDYKDFVVIDRTVYAITKGDSLVSFNLNDDQIEFINSEIIALAKNSKGNLIIANKKGSIFEFKNKDYRKIDFLDGRIYKIIVDKNDNLVIISNKSIYYKKQHYLPQKKSSMYGMFGGYKINKKQLVPIDVFFLDSNERIWFGYDAGEWGGDVCFFDLSSKKFYEGESLRALYYDKNDSWPKNTSDLLHEFPDKIKVFDKDTLSVFPHEFTLSNIKGIAEDESGNIYTSESLMHFTVSGSITKFKKMEKKCFYKNIDISDVLQHKIYQEKIIDVLNDDNSTSKMTISEWKEVLEYLGCITHNYFDKHIYYYTNNGFFKIIEKDDLYSKEFIFRPWITWTSGMEDAVGYQMNVDKMEFISKEELLFLTSNNGIGYFDGEKVKYFK